MLKNIALAAMLASALLVIGTWPPSPRPTRDQSTTTQTPAPSLRGCAGRQRPTTTGAAPATPADQYDTTTAPAASSATQSGSDVAATTCPRAAIRPPHDVDHLDDYDPRHQRHFAADQDQL